MNNFDLIIATHQELMILEAQKIDLMKRHFDALVKGSKDDPNLLISACMYKVVIDSELKIMDSMKNTLKKYIELKLSHEE